MKLRCLRKELRMNRFRAFFAGFILSMFLSGIAFAQLPAPPRDLTGSYSPVAVTLSWLTPESVTPPSFYKVYRFGDWEIDHIAPLGTTADTSYTDTSVSPGHYYYYAVTAVYNSALESYPSNHIRIFTGTDTTGDSSHIRIWFTSEPVRSAVAGQPYQYLPAVQTSPMGVQVCFSLADGPEGMTADPSTGLIQWTPGHDGMFEVKLLARACNGSDEDAEQEFTLYVLSGGASSLSGTVTDTNGTGIPNVKVKLFDVSSGDFVLHTETDDSGHYSFPLVNPSTYYLRVKPEDEQFAPQWYDGASSIGDAKPVVIPDSSAVNVNIVLKSIQKVFYTLSGTVMDDSAHPVAGATIIVLHTGQDTTECRQYDDHRDGWDDFDNDHDARTDEQGQYTVLLRPGDYSVGAMARGFLPQFWDHKSSPLEADHLLLSSDTSGINFSLVPRVEASGSISGLIRNASDSTGIKVNVVGFRKDSSGHYSGWKTFTRSDSTGAYSLEHLPDGFYIVLAFREHDFIPTFYSAGGSTPFIDSATAVAVTGGGAVTGIDIYAQPDSVEGLNGIIGEVDSDSAGHSGKSAVRPLSVSPLPGVIVTAVGPANIPAGSSVTASDGSYSIAGLAPGTYTLTFQTAGMTTATVPVAVQYTNAIPDVRTVNVQMSTAGGSSQMGVLNVDPRWNLISLPVDAADMRVSVLFPGAASRAFSYQANYHAEDVLAGGAAYWLKFTTGQQIALNGSPVMSGSINVVPGWNLVGSISVPVNVSSITSNPPAIKTSQFFGYAGKYAVSDVITPGKGYWVKVDQAGTLLMSAGQAGSTASIRIVPTADTPPLPPDAVSAADIPSEYGLAQSYPNPFNPSTTIGYQLSVKSRVILRIYNTLGEIVATLVDGVQEAGDRTVEWNAASSGGISSGVYFYRLEATSTENAGTSFIQTRKMVLIK